MPNNKPILLVSVVILGIVVSFCTHRAIAIVFLQPNFFEQDAQNR